MKKETKDEKEIKKEGKQIKKEVVKKQEKQTNAECPTEYTSKVLIAITLVVTCLTILTVSTILFINLAECLKYNSKKTSLSTTNVNSVRQCNIK